MSSLETFNKEKLQFSQNRAIRIRGPVELSGTAHLTKGKKLIFALLIFAFSILVIDVCSHVFYRVVAGQWLWQWWAVPLYESDGLRAYRVKSNLDYVHKTSEYTARYYTNAQGFRTGSEREPTAVEKPKDTYRVMYLGPSFAFGWGVNFEQSYAYLISRRLRVPDRRIEIINVGTPGQPIDYQLAWFKKEGYRYSPDLIVQTVYADSCMNIRIDGALPDDLPYVKGGYLYPPHPKNLSEAIQQAIRHYRRYSALLFFGWRMYVALMPSNEKNGTGQELYQDLRGRDSCGPSEVLEKYLAYQRFIRLLVKKRIPIVFVYVPLAYVVRPADIIRVKHHGDKKDPLAERSKTRGTQEVLKDNGVYFADLTDALVHADEKRRMYRLYDIHFTPDGNQVAADIATPLIQRAIDRNLSATK